MALITKGDPLYAYFKWERRTNYKENMLNTLGVWELPGVFGLYQGALAGVATVFASSSSSDEIRKVADTYSARVEVARKIAEESKVS